MAQMENAMEELRLPKALVDAITHPADYISGIGKEGKAFRKIFKDQEYNTLEKAAILQLKTLVTQNHIILPSIGKELRMAKNMAEYSLQRSIGATCIVDVYKMDKSFEWSIFNIQNRGAFYQYGRDKQLRPVIILNIHQINPKNDSEEITIQALCALLRVVQKYMFVRGKIENWVIILETNKMSFFKFPIGILKVIIQTLSVNFNATLDHLFILHPSTSFNMVWSGASNFIDQTSKEKITFVSSNKEMNRLHIQIDLAQLERKYGGYREDLKHGDFWPPRNTVDIQPQDHHLIDKEFRAFSKQLEQKLQQNILKANNDQTSRSSSENNSNNGHCENNIIEKERTTTEQEYQRADSKMHAIRQHRRISGVSNSDKPSIGSFHSTRTVFKSAFSSFNEEFQDMNENFEEYEPREIFYSFDDTTNNVERGRQDWQKWTVLGDEEDEIENGKRNEGEISNNRENKLNSTQQGNYNILDKKNGVSRGQQTHEQSLISGRDRNNLVSDMQTESLNRETIMSTYSNNKNRITINCSDNRNINHDSTFNAASQHASSESVNSIIAQINHRNSNEDSLYIVSSQANGDRLAEKKNNNQNALSNKKNIQEEQCEKSYGNTKSGGTTGRKSGDSYKNNVIDFGRANKDKKPSTSNNRKLTQQKGIFFCC